MSYDALGRELKVGDFILIPYRVTSITAGEEYCNVSARSMRGRKPDDSKEWFSGNSVVVFRSNPGDKTDAHELWEATGNE